MVKYLATSLDYADQRYYYNQFGRFMTPDPYAASVGPSDPGSWNQYAYTRGDPVNRYDPLGLQDADPSLGPADRPTFSVTVLAFGLGDAASMAAIYNSYLAFQIGLSGSKKRSAEDRELATVSLAYTRLRGLLRNDADCTGFLASSLDVLSTNTFLDRMLPLIGPGDLPLGTNAQQGPIGSGYDITLNRSGAFFSKNAGVGFADKHASDVAKLQAGQFSAQAFILLHELAHELGAKGFVPEGQDRDHSLTKKNNDLLWDNCSKTLNATLPPVY